MSEKCIQTSDTPRWTPPQKPAKRTFEYVVHPDDERYEFETRFTADAPYWLAEEAADDFYHEHDGWESSWPMAFRIYDGDVDLGLWSVDVERVPQFSAIRLAT